jgi:hypothetical protein
MPLLLEISGAGRSIAADDLLFLTKPNVAKTIYNRFLWFTFGFI